MTQQPPPLSSVLGPGAGERPRDGLDRFFDRARATGVRRRLSDRWLAGVCAGVADKIGVDPVVVRVGVFLAVALGGVGVPAYFLAFSLMADTKGEIPLEKAVRHGDSDSVVLLLFTGLLVVSALGDLGGLGQGSHANLAQVVLWLLVAGVATWWWTHRDDRSARAVDRPQSSPAPPGSASGGTVASDPAPTGPAAGRPGPASPALAWPAAHSPSAPVAPRPIPAGAAAPRAGAPAPVPETRRRPTLGVPGTVATLGLALTGAAAVVAGTQSGRLQVAHPVEVAAAVALGLSSVLLVVIGLAGRRGGFTVPVVVALVITCLGYGSGELTTRDGHWQWRSALGDASWSTGVGDLTWAPTSLVGQETYEVGAGDGTLDLTRLPAAQAKGRTVRAEVGVGDLTVLVPTGTTVRVRGDVGLGQLELEPLEGPSRSLGDGEAFLGTGEPDLTIDAQVGLGTLTVKEVAR